MYIFDLWEKKTFLTFLASGKKNYSSGKKRYFKIGIWEKEIMHIFVGIWEKKIFMWEKKIIPSKNAGYFLTHHDFCLSPWVKWGQDDNRKNVAQFRSAFPRTV